MGAPSLDPARCASHCPALLFPSVISVWLPVTGSVPLQVCVMNELLSVLITHVGITCLGISRALRQESLPHQWGEWEKIKTDTEGNVFNKLCIIKNVTTTAPGYLR